MLAWHPVRLTQAPAESRLLSTNERTARNAVSRLAAAGILAQRSAGRRNKVFECSAMMDAFTEAAREQPADNLSLLSARDRVDEFDSTSPRQTSKSAAGRQPHCNATTTRGGACTHPQPRPGGSCPAGHPYRA